MRRWLGVAALAAGLMAPGAAHAAVTKQALTFDVMVGANRDQPCEVAADLYTPDGASVTNQMPAIMATNGFGGSKAEFEELGMSYAERGYVFLAYSGLGFGGSGCKITLDDREHDGAAGSQLISFLGGSKAAQDGTKIDYVVSDGVDHVGKERTDDPRVGMIGGSYGGQIQFAVAAVDKRLDTIIPQITWNDLSYSLSPNNTDFTRGVTYGTPGVVKIDWPVLFFGVGTGQGLAASLADPSHVGTCPNFADEVCPALIAGASRGYLDEAGLALLRNASVSSYYDEVVIPTFLTQGQSDNLFNLQETVTTYKALRERDVPVKMLWRSSGHSGGGLGEAENDPTNPEAAYESRLDLAWFDHYLKGKGARPALDFSFITDWIDFPDGADAAPAVGVVPSYPAGRESAYFLSGEDALVTEKGKAQPGGVTVQSSAAPTSAGGGFVDPAQTDGPGTAASWTTPPLTSDLDVAGIPSLTFSVDAPTFGAAADPAQRLILHAKLYDVAPDGTQSLVRNQSSAARIAQPGKPVTIEIPGQVHRYAKGHALRVTVATTAASYRGSFGAGSVTINSGPESVLTLPVLGRQAGAVGSGPQGLTPFAPAAGKPSSVARPAAKFPGRRVCRGGRRLRFRLKVKRRVSVARVTVNGKTRIIRGSALRRPKVIVRLPRRASRVVVTTTLVDGSTRRTARSYPACR
ncbi:MAG: CocE/NonD family hydrolase [Solirubrobacteraceae bacterium]